MRAMMLALMAIEPVISHHDCGKPVYDEAATCVKICTQQIKKKVWAVKALSWPVTRNEKEAVPQGRVCVCYTERAIVTDGVTATDDLPPEMLK